MVAPLYGEGRGLKPFRALETLTAIRVAPLYGEGRGLKRKLCGQLGELPAGRSSLWRGAWIETRMPLGELFERGVAPLYGEGRGLKPPGTVSEPVWMESLLSMERGVD